MTTIATIGLEAVQRPSMRFVPIKQREQQTDLVLHRTRHLLIRQLTAVTNTIRAHLAEFGIVAPVGRRGVHATKTPSGVRTSWQKIGGASRGKASQSPRPQG